MPKYCVRDGSFVANDFYCDGCGQCAPASKEHKEGK